MNIKTSHDDAGKRLDSWLAVQLNDLSRARIQSLIKSGHITVNGQQVKSRLKLSEGFDVEIEFPEPDEVELTAENIPLDIIFEDADIVVVNKPAGMVVHPAAGHSSGTLVNALLHHCEDLAGIGGELRPGIVHRIDKDTSGLIVVAKNEQAMNALAAQFKNRTVKKEYLALVWGRPNPVSGRIETTIGRSPHDRKKMSTASKTGRDAITNYSTLETFRDISLLSVIIETGRTHQIRVHMAHIKHPILGDRQYGRKGAAELPAPVKRQMLHASLMKIQHPGTNQPREFSAAIPADMKALLTMLHESGPNG